MLTTDIQNRIKDVVEAGTFPVVTYSGNTASTGASESPSSIVINELAGNVSRAVSQGARDGKASLVNWVFEARLKWDSEVDFSEFLTDELKQVAFTYQNETRVVMVPGFQAGVPPRQGAHNGTELVITFTVNTRR